MMVCKRHDFTGLAFVKDCLVFSDDNVFNLVIDKLEIERILIGEDETIRRLFRNGRQFKDTLVKGAIGYKFYR